MKFVKEDLTLYNIRAHSLRGKEFYKGILDFRKKILPLHKHRIQKSEEYKCLLCGGNEGLTLLEWEEGYQIIQCNNCGVSCPNISFSENEEVSEELDREKIQYEIYVQAIDRQYDYRKNQFGGDRYRYIIDRLGMDPKKIQLLDIGCGAGYFLSYLKERGVNSKGLDTNPNTVRYCIDRGLCVASGDLMEEEDEQYDVIVLFDVLEHLLDPISIMRAAAKKLKNKGYVVIFTTNIHSVSYELMGGMENTLVPFEHVCFYDLKSFQFLAEKSGLSVHSLDTFGLDLMDYLLMKEHDDGFPYTEKLHEMMTLVQGCLDKLKVSNHFRLTLQKL
jgi:SAM-dependent methyltransferase